MTITTTSRFTEEPLKIATAVNENAGAVENEGLVNVIKENERLLLKQVLGDTQYAALLTELGKTPFTPGAPEAAGQEYVDLVEGTSDGLWEGLRPMLDNFIFCAWLRETEVVTTMVGSGKGKSQGFTIADNSSKFTMRWNIFVEKLYDLWEYLGDSGDFERPSDFPYYETVNSLGL